jgi:hypothetical protein
MSEILKLEVFSEMCRPSVSTNKAMNCIFYFFLLFFLLFFFILTLTSGCSNANWYLKYFFLTTPKKNLEKYKGSPTVTVLSAFFELFHRSPVPNLL